MNSSPNDTSSPCKVMTEVKVVGLRVDPLNLCNLSVINKIKSCPLFYFINTLCSVWTVCLYYGSSFAHKRVCTNYVQPIGCYFFMVVILWFQGPLHLDSSIYSYENAAYLMIMLPQTTIIYDTPTACGGSRIL